METYVVEHYWPGATAEEFERAAGRVRASAGEMACDGTGIRFLHSTFVPGDEAAYCVLAAASAGLVAEAFRRADVSYERILDALDIDGGSPL